MKRRIHNRLSFRVEQRRISGIDLAPQGFPNAAIGLMDDAAEQRILALIGQPNAGLIGFERRQAKNLVRPRGPRTLWNIEPDAVKIDFDDGTAHSNQ